MREVLILLFLFIFLNAHTQHVVKGVVYGPEGVELEGAQILEMGTPNQTETNGKGQYELRTLHDTSVLRFSYVGFKIQTIYVSSDTTINICLNNDYYNTRWLTIRSNYEFFNSLFGFQVSNGIDEEPLIHFEDFHDRFLLKVHGQTDINNSYSYGAEIGVYKIWKYIGQTTLKYDVLHVENAELFLRDLNLRSRIGYFRNTALVI